MNLLAASSAAGRRTFMTGGVKLAAVVFASSLGLRTARAADKLAKSVVQYDESMRTPGRDCDDCAQFVPGADAAAKGTCLVVAGDISPHGHCIAFTPRQR